LPRLTASRVVKKKSFGHSYKLSYEKSYFKQKRI
jgi:hypothetical protein